MKKYILLNCAALFLCTIISNAQCEVFVAPSLSSIVCSGDSVELSARPINPVELQASNTAGNNQRGNMFDLEILHDLYLDSIAVSPMGSTNIEIYYKSGSYVGFENSPSDWTLVGSGPVQYTGGFVKVPINLNLELLAGNTYAFYVTSSNTSIALNYSNGNNAGTLYNSDANINFYEGVGLEYPFTNGTGAIYNPRVFNGAFYYTKKVAVNYLWQTGETTNVISPVVISDTSFTVNVDITGCPTFTNQFQITVSEVEVNAGSDINICVGLPIVLGATSADSIYWLNGVQDSVAFVPDSSRFYYAKAENSIGCKAIDSVFVNVVTLQAGITLDNTNATLEATPSNLNYSWMFCDSGMLVPSENEYRFSVPVNGYYSVIISDTSSGCIDTSNCVLVNMVGLDNVYNSKELKLYPNPTKDFIQFSVENISEVKSIRMIDMQGRVLQVWTNIKGNMLNLNQVPSGVYILDFEMGTQHVLKSFIIE